MNGSFILNGNGKVFTPVCSLVHPILPDRIPFPFDRVFFSDADERGSFVDVLICLFVYICSLRAETHLDLMGANSNRMLKSGFKSL